jgi:hypothetical protein
VVQAEPRGALQDVPPDVAVPRVACSVKLGGTTSDAAGSAEPGVLPVVGPVDEPHAQPLRAAGHAAEP